MTNIFLDSFIQGVSSMKTTCPHCSQKYDLDVELSGRVVTCSACDQDFVVSSRSADAPKSNLYQCPDCGRDISRRAASCPHCGAPVEAPPPVVVPGGPAKPAPAPAPPPPGNKIASPKRNEGDGVTITGALVALAGVVFFFASGNLILSSVVLLLGVALMGAGIMAGAPVQQILCPNPQCGYKGPGKADGGSNGCLLVVLLLLGILPGILYLLIVGRSGVVCPKCGIRIR